MRNSARQLLLDKIAVQLIKEHRTRFGFSQAELAKKLDISEKLLSRIETHKVGIPMSAWMAFCELAQIEVHLPLKIARQEWGRVKKVGLGVILFFVFHSSTLSDVMGFEYFLA